MNLRVTPIAQAAANSAQDAPVKRESKQSPMSLLFDNVAKQHGLTTFSQYDATADGWLIWVTKGEADPVKALLSAALSILVHRGHNDARGGVSIKKLMVQANGLDYYWKVMSNDGLTVIAEGYAATENQAAMDMIPHLTAREPAAPDVNTPDMFGKN